MAKFTPSIAKNQMRRAMLAICDPLPSKTEVNQLWKHFNNCCAYCEISIDRKSRTGQLDHLLATADGGDNSIFNFVLSCPTCNGDEKREAEWTMFLKTKASSNSESYASRWVKINDWIQKRPLKTRAVGADNKNIEIDAIIKETIENFESAIKKIRALKA